MDKMFLAVLFVLGQFGQLSSGVPLEDPSADFKQFFDSRIVGGTEAADGKFPHMAALVVGGLWQSFVCGGSIIKTDLVLTAAHCVTGFIQWNGELLNTFHAIVGTNTWHKGTIVEFKGYRNHPEYDQWLIKNDVGVLFTKWEIPLNERISPIELNFDFMGGGQKCYVTGWGTDMLWGVISDKLQQLVLTTVAYEQCVAGILEAATQWGGMTPPVDRIVEICTFHSAGHGMCHGDSGSALVLKSSRKQIGIVSWGLPCAIGAPDVFASIFGAKSFLLPIIRREH